MINYRENNIWSVYIHISPSNKYYVGITSQNPISARWCNGKGYRNNLHFWRAIQKYGWNNFEHEIFAEHLTKDEACEMEKILIRELDSNDTKHGYNKSSGGEYGRAGIKLSDEVKEKIRISNTGKFVSEETKQKISKNHIHSFYGDNHSSKETYQFDMNGVFIKMYDSAKRASDETKIDRHSICVACSKNRMAGNYLWAHADNIIKIDGTYMLKVNTYYDKRNVIFNKEVYQFTINGDFIAKYNSTKEATDKTGIPRGTIISNARCKNKSKNYIWRYKEDVEESVENTGSFLLKEN